MTNQIFLQPPPISVSVDDAARMIGVGTTTMWKLVKEGQVETRRFHRRTLVMVESLRTFVHSLPVEATAHR